MKTFSVIAACRGRHILLRQFIKSVFETAQSPYQVELWCMADSDDTPTHEIARELRDLHGWDICLNIQGRKPNLNRDYVNKAAALSNSKFLWVLGNDQTIDTPNWDKILNDKLEQYLVDKADRIVYGYNSDDIHKSIHEGGCCSPIVSKEVVDALGFYMPPEFNTWSSDDALWKLFLHAKQNRICDCMEVSTSHYSHHTGKAERDQISHEVEANQSNSMTPEKMLHYVNLLNEAMQ